MLAALAPQLTGDLLAQGLTAALAIRSERDGATALIEFLSLTDNQLMLIRQIRQRLVGYLLTNHEQKDEHILDFCAKKKLFSPPILSRTILETIVQHIIEICTEWQWV